MAGGGVGGPVLKEYMPRTGEAGGRGGIWASESECLGISGAVSTLSFVARTRWRSTGDATGRGGGKFGVGIRMFRDLFQLCGSNLWNAFACPQDIPCAQAAVR